MRRNMDSCLVPLLERLLSALQSIADGIVLLRLRATVKTTLFDAILLVHSSLQNPSSSSGGSKVVVDQTEHARPHGTTSSVQQLTLTVI